MAQLVLSNLGSMVGQQLAPEGLSAFGFQVSGEALGRNIGSLVGSAIDARYLTPPIEGPRIREFNVTESREGASIPVVYGRVRVGSQLIWAARFTERRDTGGGKGGPRTRTYSYSLSFAVGLCEGEVSQVTRCWANGEPLDLSTVTWRLYRGTEDQTPDPLIEAIEGAGAAPAYRGLAYIVFEDLGVDDFGARLPQLSFELVRPAGGVGRMEEQVRAINLIPGSGEFALATDVVRRSIGPGREVAENQHSAEARSDFEASLDQLMAELPNLARVNLVVSWFGDDLRSGTCRIRPGVEIGDKETKPWAWSAAGVSRGDAYVVSQTAGRPNYGGTPADEAVRQAIAALKARGLHITLYPFVLMDVPPGNGLADPYLGSEQASFPWRGRITCAPAPGRVGTVDGSGAAATQVAAFFAGAGGYREFILHYASLGAEEGVDGLLIGSELIGLTRVRDGSGGYPAVAALQTLANDVRAILPDAEISYAADWTEYGAHVIGDDVRFPLDALWADDAISYVGLDWYPPMGDWRDGEAHADATFGDEHALAYLNANIEGGEAFDWYYADDAARSAQTRVAISDGAYGEPWVFRQKDVRGWWEHDHYPRTSGVRSAMRTAWRAGLKPVRFVEFGCPAIDKGANQPNVFYDPKSSESGLPHFSDGSRDDLIQRRAIEAFHAHWAADNPLVDPDMHMLPEDGIALWAWDARPWPAFPARVDVWADAGNWRLGHWLNGRLGLALLPDVLGDICLRAGVADADVGEAAGIVSGYRFDGPTSARRAIDPLMLTYGLDAVEREGVIAIGLRGETAAPLAADLLVEEKDGRTSRASRGSMEAPTISVRLRFIDAEANHAPGVALSTGAGSEELSDIEAAVVMDRGQAQRLADALAAELTAQRERLSFAVASGGLAFEVGDRLSFEGVEYRVLEASAGVSTRFAACRVGPARSRILTPAIPVAPPARGLDVEPDVVLIDGPPSPGEEDDLRPLAFAYAEPWSGALRLSAGADETLLTQRGSVDRPCAMGWLTTALFPHVSGRWQETSVWVSLRGAQLASETDLAVLNGANAAFVETSAGWELIQFQQAELVDHDAYKLTRLLRGQQGSEPEMAAGASVGARILFLTGAEQRMEIAAHEQALDLVWRAWRRSPEESGAWSGEFIWNALGQRMWSPAQLRAVWAAGDLSIDWIRRARKAGDPWTAGEPPLEGLEQYRVRVLAGGVELRTWITDSNIATYAAADIAADFPSGGTAVIEVSQIGANGLPGSAAQVSITIP